MNFPEQNLPSNKQFGGFFCLIFLIASVVAYFSFSLLAGHLFLLTFISFLYITLTKPQLLHRLNKLWFSFGILLGKLFSPIILGAIFFLLITPVAIFLRMINRDELRLVLGKKASYWCVRETSVKSSQFKNQF